MKKVVFGWLVFSIALVQIFFANKVYAASPGTFDCTPSGGVCRIARQSCSPGTESDPEVCQAITDQNTCRNKLDVPCISDPNANTAECFVYNGTVCKARSVSCQQGYKESCSGRSLSNCTEPSAACVLESTNTSGCYWDVQSRACKPDALNNDCRSGYKPYCAGRSESACQVASSGVPCVSDDQGPGPTIPVYDPRCASGGPYGINYGGVKTALGCLPTDPQYFINLTTPWAIGIGSGIAFLLGLYGSLMIVISAGDPEKMQAGKEIITSAIAGLLLIVFAVFILRIIGVDVLKLF